MHNTILSSLMLLLLPVTASAQFYTITKGSDLMPDAGRKTMQAAAKEDDTISNIVQSVRNDTLHINTLIKEKNEEKGQKGNKRTSPKSELPELTIPNVCRNKHNLFGLTNPRTGKYFEFDHWTESVLAYYTKVQYRYKGGNYLLWLRNIGYAEDPRYVRSLSRILEQYL